MPTTVRVLIAATAVLALLIAATASTGAAHEDQIVRVTLKDYEVELSNVVVAPSKLVQFVVANQGALPHRFDVQPFLNPGTADPGNALVIGPGTIRVIPRTLSPGVYRVTCAIGDHAKWGMVSVLSAQTVPERPSPLRAEIVVPFVAFMLGSAYIILDSLGLRLTRAN